MMGNQITTQTTLADMINPFGPYWGSGYYNGMKTYADRITHEGRLLCYKVSFIDEKTNIGFSVMNSNESATIKECFDSYDEEDPMRQLPYSLRAID